MNKQNVRIINQTNKIVIVSNMELAQSFTQRLIGLMGRKIFIEGSGLWIKQSGNSIHTFFMRFPIDLIFLNKEKNVKYLVKNMSPWRVVMVPTLSSLDCLEVPAGTIEKHGLKLGDILHVEA
jgi:uncharacterized membrane protein (UPF0127 family)